jgi:hypothetical protein
VITTLYGKKAICASHFFIQRINQIIVDRVALCRGGKELSKKETTGMNGPRRSMDFDVCFRAFQPALAAR